jgi:hypothetical protein
MPRGHPSSAFALRPETRPECPLVRSSARALWGRNVVVPDRGVRTIRVWEYRGVLAIVRVSDLGAVVLRVMLVGVVRRIEGCVDRSAEAPGLVATLRPTRVVLSRLPRLGPLERETDRPTRPGDTPFVRETPVGRLRWVRVVAVGIAERRDEPAELDLPTDRLRRGVAVDERVTDPRAFRGDGLATEECPLLTCDGEDRDALRPLLRGAPLALDRLPPERALPGRGLERALRFADDCDLRPFPDPAKDSAAGRLKPIVKIATNNRARSVEIALMTHPRVLAHFQALQIRGSSTISTC